jgi:peptidyl-prolyl cis-trans isomerase C
MHFGSVLALVALMLGCGGETETSSEEVVAGATSSEGVLEAIVHAEGDLIATVGAGGVGVEEFTAAAIRTAPADGEALSAEERKDVLEQLITEEALWQEAAKKGLYRDPKVRKIMVNLLLREEIYSNVNASDFSDEEMQRYYDEHREEFVVPEKIQVKRIFLRVSDKRSLEEATSQASDIRRQIVAAPDRFKELAAEFSEDPYKRRGGDLGYISREGKPGIDPAVVLKAFELDVQAVSEPFEAGGGINIVAVANKRDRVERTFAQMKGTALRKLKNEKYKELTDGYVEGIRKNFNVKIDEATLAAVDLNAAKVRRPEARSAGPVDPDVGSRPLSPSPQGSVAGDED